jgi:hypothetical protein
VLVDDGRFFGFVAALCLLFWLLGRERRLDPNLRRWLSLGAYAVLGIGIGYAAFETLGWFLQR